MIWLWYTLIGNSGKKLEKKIPVSHHFSFPSRLWGCQTWNTTNSEYPPPLLRDVVLNVPSEALPLVWKCDTWSRLVFLTSYYLLSETHRRLPPTADWTSTVTFNLPPQTSIEVFSCTTDSKCITPLRVLHNCLEQEMILRSQTDKLLQQASPFANCYTLCWTKPGHRTFSCLVRLFVRSPYRHALLPWHSVKQNVMWLTNWRKQSDTWFHGFKDRNTITWKSEVSFALKISEITVMIINFLTGINGITELQKPEHFSIQVKMSNNVTGQTHHHQLIHSWL